MKTLKQISRKIIYSGRIVQLEILKLLAPDKKIITRELIRHSGASVIIPVMKNGSFVLVYQYRVATNRYILEFPAGTLEPNEKPEECARREIIEEIGYRAGKLTKLSTFYPAPGVSTERMHLYLATDLKLAKKNPDDDEWIETKIVSFKELERKIKKGIIEDGKTILGFYFYLEYLKKKSK